MKNLHITKAGYSCNSKVNDRGKNITSTAGPKDTSMGMDLGPKATNTKSGTKVQTEPLSPNANAQSRNGA